MILSGKQLIEKMCRKRVEVAYAEKSGEECDGGIRDVTVLRCSEPLRSKIGGASKPSPGCAGWDRLGIAVYSLQLIVIVYD